MSNIACEIIPAMHDGAATEADTLRRQAQLRPDHIAVRYGGRELSAV